LGVKVCTCHFVALASIKLGVISMPSSGRLCQNSEVNLLLLTIHEDITESDNGRVSGTTPLLMRPIFRASLIMVHPCKSLGQGRHH